MDEVILSADGMLLGRGGDKAPDPLRCLAARVAPDPDCTLRSFVRMLLAWPELQRLNDFAPQFAAQYGQWPGRDCIPAGLVRLELSRVVEVIGHPAPPRLEIYHTLRGIAPGGEDMEVKGWRVEMLLDVPLALGALRHVVFGDRVEMFRFQTVCSLFDFIEGICWQLAFHGTPLECALRR